MNKISSLNGFYDIVKREKTSPNENFEFIGVILSDLTDEIVAQRQLVAAENGDLSIRIEPVFFPNLINRIIQQISQISNPKQINVINHPENINITISTDLTLLNRIITNMLKNAIEASEPNQIVEIKTDLVGKNLSISIHNNNFIPKDSQLQIFQRSFSTKGENRGLGTYSIKLLSENYLKGKAYFMSSESEGTTFTVEIPIT